MLCILKSMFSKSKSRVKWNNYFSETLENLYGVLQCGLISPTLFTVFLEDLPDYLDLTCCVSMDNFIISYLLHADDLVFISETPEGLQKHIDGLHEFCRQWHMIVNLMETNVCVFNRKASNILETQNALTMGKRLSMAINTSTLAYTFLTLKPCSNQPAIILLVKQTKLFLLPRNMQWNL